MLVLIGATPEGKKELIGFQTGMRESVQSWLHKTLNVLDKFPKSVQPNAHKDLHEIWLAPDRATAETAIAAFAAKYAPKIRQGPSNA